MADYSDDIATALGMIEEFGQLVEWHKDVVTLSDPDKPWQGGTTDPVIKTPYVCFVPPSTSATSGFGLEQFIGGTEVGDFSNFGLMGAVDFEPNLSDKVYRNGTLLVIQKIDKVQPAEQVVLYILSIV